MAAFRGSGLGKSEIAPKAEKVEKAEKAEKLEKKEAPVVDKGSEKGSERSSRRASLASAKSEVDDEMNTKHPARMTRIKIRHAKERKEQRERIIRVRQENEMIIANKLAARGLIR